MSSVCDLHRCPCTRMLRVLNVLLRGCPSSSATDTVLMMRVCVSEGSLHAQLPSCPCPGPWQARACCWGGEQGHKGSWACRPATIVILCTPYM